MGLTSGDCGATESIRWLCHSASTRRLDGRSVYSGELRLLDWHRYRRFNIHVNAIHQSQKESSNRRCDLSLGKSVQFQIETECSQVTPFGARSMRKLASVAAESFPHPGRPTRRRSSLNRASDRSGSKAGRSRMDGLNRAS